MKEVGWKSSGMKHSERAIWCFPATSGNLCFGTGSDLHNLVALFMLAQMAFLHWIYQKTKDDFIFRGICVMSLNFIIMIEDGDRSVPMVSYFKYPSIISGRLNFQDFGNYWIRLLGKYRVISIAIASKETMWQDSLSLPKNANWMELKKLKKGE